MTSYIQKKKMQLLKQLNEDQMKRNKTQNKKKYEILVAF